jgi:hypothetical protein
MDSKQCDLARSRFCVIYYVREYESIFETAWAHELGDQGYWWTKKTGGRKSREAVPFRQEQVFTATFVVSYSDGASIYVPYPVKGTVSRKILRDEGMGP